MPTKCNLSGIRTAIVAGLCICGFATSEAFAQGVPDGRANSAPDEIATLKAENERLKGLAPIQKQITAKDRKGFRAAYREALTGCNGCHAASDKPFLHVKVPDRPEALIMDFDPQETTK